MRVSNASRESSVSDCMEAQAPNWLWRGREAKYVSASASLTGVTAPSTRTWMPASRRLRHRNSRAARGLSCSSRPFWLCVWV